MRNTMNRNHVTPGTVTSELKVSSKSNSPIIITAVFTQERPGLENPGCKRNEKGGAYDNGAATLDSQRAYGGHVDVQNMR